MKYLSMCGVLRNEAPYIVEWIEHYLKMGVEHFYLFDNESTDNVLEVIRPYKDKGLITWHTTHGLRQQRVAYNHVIREYRNDTEWCCFFDLDEFGYSGFKQEVTTGFLGGHVGYKFDTLKETIEGNYDEITISGIAIHWLLFGSNGHLDPSIVPVKERFTKRAATVNAHVKSIMRLNQTYSMNLDPHSFLASGDIIDENHTVMERDYAITTPATADILRLNHYYCKSKAEHMKRKLLPDANSGVIKDALEQFLAHDVNEVEDKRILEI